MTLVNVSSFFWTSSVLSLCKTYTFWTCFFAPQYSMDFNTAVKSKQILLYFRCWSLSFTAMVLLDIKLEMVNLFLNFLSVHRCSTVYFSASFVHVTVTKKLQYWQIYSKSFFNVSSPCDWSLWTLFIFAKFYWNSINWLVPYNCWWC